MMISHDDLTRLAALESEHGILSAYLKLDPQLLRDPAQPAMKFKGAAKRFLRRSDDRWRAALDREKGRVLEFLEGWSPRGRTLTLFACAPAGIWEVISLDVPLPSLVTVDATTHTALLAQCLDEHPVFAVVVVQRDKAQVYVAQERGAESMEAIESEVPGRHDQGGWAQARWQRHIEFHVAEHLKKVIEELERLLYQKRFNRLAVGGPEETVAEFVRMLPDPLARTVLATFSVNLKHDTDAMILERARRARDEHERRSELELIHRLADAAGPHGRGTLGIGPSVDAIVAGRVLTLLVVDGLEAEGSACSRCAYFAAERFDRCPACDGAAERVQDLVERAVERAYLAGAHVEFVFGAAREWLLERAGMGALLRF